jgi:K+-sensing histidine kinase KdpD
MLAGRVIGRRPSAGLLQGFGYDAPKIKKTLGEVMRSVGWPMAVALSLAVACGVTAVLWYVNAAGGGIHHPVFFYLLPIALLAILYGSLPALLCAGTGTVCAAYFLYNPVYTFQFANRLEVADLIVFLVLAAVGVKCTRELLRPSGNPSPISAHAKSLTERK